MIRIAFLTLIAGIAANSASAIVLDGAIVEQNGRGSFVKLDTETPFDVGQDNFNTDNLYAFDEGQNIVLPDTILVDIGGDNGTLAAGTEVASHYVFFDSIQGKHMAYVDFDAPILGVAAHQDTMAATDFLANTSVNYIGTELRGLERGDYVWVDEENASRLWMFWSGWSPGDYIRVFTQRSVGALMM